LEGVGERGGAGGENRRGRGGTARSPLTEKKEETMKYWRKREDTNALNALDSVKVEKLYKSQKGKCPTCENTISDEQIRENGVQTHHVLPKSQNGEDELSNLRLLHHECQKYLRRINSLEEMRMLWNEKRRYFTLKSRNTHLKPKSFKQVLLQHLCLSFWRAVCGGAPWQTGGQCG
jgi:hypothetical protein